MKNYLYAAADFYALEPLKEGCSEILKDGLSRTSALVVLTLADLHQDKQLKSAALDFISLNDHDIVGTEDWIKFEKENGDLALETLRELYLRKIRGAAPSPEPMTHPSPSNPKPLPGGSYYSQLRGIAPPPSSVAPPYAQQFGAPQYPQQTMQASGAFISARGFPQIPNFR